MNTTLPHHSTESFSSGISIGKVFYITVLATVGLYIYYGERNIDLFSATAVPVTLFFALLFVAKLGNQFPVKEIMILLTAIQFLYSPFLAYYFYEPDPIYPMEVEPEIYFGYAVPGVILFAFGLYLFRQPVSLQKLPDVLKEFNIDVVGRQLIIIGIIADFAISFAPGGLAFFLLLISYCKFIGAYYLYFHGGENTKWWIFAAFLPLIIRNVAHGMFHELLLWGLFSMMIYFVKSKFSFTKKAIIILLSFVSVYYLNIIKKSYREATWNAEINYSTSERIMIFGESILNVAVGEGIINNESGEAFEEDEHNLTRLNQGVIVSRVIDHTGKREPYADGETIEGAIEAALVPRMLNPSKVRSGGFDTYTRFTGYGLGKNTSISLSLLGEGYANYGNGGIFFMFFLGMFYSFIIWKVGIYSKKYPYLLLWIPFLFLTVIKAEEGFETVLNYLIKAIFVLWGLHTFYLKKITFRKDGLVL